jgi:ParB-like chromosome segregation protein Spo0J
MRVELKSLQPNPFRNFKVDPIDPEVVKSLKDSIKDNPGGFWGGIVARKTKHNGIQLAFGHHRVRAAIAAGIREDDIKVVPDISDADMIRMYANENATQRGNTGTALAGTVASAIRFLLKGLFTGDLSGFPLRSKKALETMRGQVGAERGLGYDVILEFLNDIPGVNQNTVKQQLANLKASGDYDEIVDALKEEIEAEQKEQLRELARLEEENRKAAEAQLLAEQREKEENEKKKEQARVARAATEEADRKRAAKAQADAELAAGKAKADAELAAKRQAEAKEKMKEFDALRKGRNAMNDAAGVEREVTFDFEGVAKHLKSASHIDTFRQIVTGAGLRPYLPVNRQAALAKKLVDGCDGELTSQHIRENVMLMVMNVRGAERRLNADEKAALLRKDWDAKARSYQNDFARQARGMLAAAMALATHAGKRPSGVTLHVTSEFRHAVEKAEDALKLIRKARVI